MAAKRGRPTKYKAEYANQARMLCLLGATDVELAEFFAVNVDSINEWKKRHEEFSVSIKEGKEKSDARIADALYNRAMGATVKKQQAIKLKEIVYENGKKVSETETVEVVDLIDEVPPDTPAAIFWLKNRRKMNWRDKQEIEVTTDDDLAALLAERRNKATGGS